MIYTARLLLALLVGLASGFLGKKFAKWMESRREDKFNK